MTIMHCQKDIFHNTSDAFEIILTLGELIQEINF
jgi:hypothetical protein